MANPENGPKEHKNPVLEFVGMWKEQIVKAENLVVGSRVNDPRFEEAKMSFDEKEKELRAYVSQFPQIKKHFMKIIEDRKPLLHIVSGFAEKGVRFAPDEQLRMAIEFFEKYSDIPTDES
jgi:hypothetical protein